MEADEELFLDHGAMARVALPNSVYPLFLDQGLSYGSYGPSLLDVAELYSSAPNEVALMNSARALGTFIGSRFGR